MKRIYVLIIIGICATAVFCIAPFVGMETISFENILYHGSDTIKADIFWKIRIPRVLMAFLSGAALALSGMTFQALFRNPLATPFTLGVSSGAAFGATIYVKSGLIISLFGISGQSVSAFIGALLAITMVYGLTCARRGFSTATMLLAGVAVSFFFSSFILFIQYMSDFTNSFRILRWLMGGLETVGFGSVLTLLPFMMIGSSIVLFFNRELNLMSVGEDIAKSRGVNVKSIKTILFFATSLMVGGVVSQCGPIGFVGMMSPHICRLLIGYDHHYLTPATLLFGGLFLTLCDIFSRILIAPAEIPVGVITALLGGPFFLWLLISGSSEHSSM